MSISEQCGRSSRHDAKLDRVNSKAQLRVPVGQLLSRLPTALHASIRTGRYYAQKSDSLLIQSDESRKQSENKQNCFRRLSELIEEEFKKVVPAETSKSQAVKVKKLQRSENEARLRMKKQQSSKKAARSKSFD
jgi:peptidyl-tRNA hydrolase ICT1